VDMADELTPKGRAPEGPPPPNEPEAGSEGQDSGAQKVELDLDDAPFLQWEQEEQADSGQEAAAPDHRASGAESGDRQQSASPWWKRRTVLLLIGGLVGVLVLAVLAWMVLWRQAPEPVAVKPEKTVKTQSTEPAPTMEKIHFEPFWVEYETESGFRHLHFEFALNSRQEKLGWEIDRKRFVIRDAIYYYLKNKKLSSLLNKGNVSGLKKDLASVVNQYLSNGRIQSILIQDYVVD